MALIYTITGDNGIYVGSTEETLKERMRKHMSAKDCMARVLINPRIELIEKCEVGIRFIREQYWMDRIDCVNVQKAPTGLTKTEYNKQHYQDNKEAYTEYSKQYYQDNKETFIANAKQYYQDNKDAICGKQKQYYQDNKEANCEYQKQYRLDNREALATKYDCPCGGKYTHGAKPRHLRSKKHQEFINVDA
jgi:hypothetical protein